MSSKMARARLLFIAVEILFTTGAFSATVSKLNDDALAPLRAPVVARRIHLERLPIYDNRRSVIDLEEFQVWAPDGKVIIHGDNGAVLQTLDPPPMRFFRGLVNGDPESFAYFSVDPSSRDIEGIIVTGEKKFAIRSQRRSKPRGRLGESDTFLTEFEDIDNVADPNPLPPWQCAVDENKIEPVSSALHAIDANGLPVKPQGISGTQSYAIRVDIETDYELYVNAGSNSLALTTYITNLSGAVSTIYNRDLKTNVTQGIVNIYTSSSDPWAATNASDGLNELGDHYGASGASASAVVMLSGKNTNSGIAWIRIICQSPFLSGGGHYVGPYAWCGAIGIGGLVSVANPNATVDSVQYGMPAYSFTNGSQFYWPLAEYAHELGHVMAGQHTHCIALTASEALSTGRNYVDTCFNAEGAGCFSGTPSGGSCDVNGFCSPAPAEKGTLMSYCHDIFAGTGGVYPQSRFLFGLASEVSHHELDDFMLNPSGPPTGYNIINAVGSFTISAITAPASVSPSSTGNSASVTASPSSGATYEWQITNGTITSSTTASSITFTAGVSGIVTLRATAYGTNHCGVTDTKSVTIGSAYNPPTSVLATAAGSASVSISWTAATGTTPGRYNVYRTADGTTYSAVGNTTGTSFTDTGAVVPLAANTAYLYKVRSAASDGSNESADSNRDLATTMAYTYSAPAFGAIVHAADLTDLRTAINAVRTLNGGMAAATYTYGTITAGSSIIHALDITEARARLNDALTGLGLTLPTYTNGTITAGSSTIQAVDFNELRLAVR